jgi:hypothetical protein
MRWDGASIPVEVTAATTEMAGDTDLSMRVVAQESVAVSYTGRRARYTRKACITKRALLPFPRWRSDGTATNKTTARLASIDPRTPT